VLTTEECLLNHNRNPGSSKAEIERTLCDYLGAEKVICSGEVSTTTRRTATSTISPASRRRAWCC